MITVIKDTFILKKIKKRDMDAVLDWFEARREKYYRIGWAYLKNHHDIEDVFHNTIIKVHDKIHQLREDRYFETWVTSIFINECRDFYRKNSHKQQEAAEQQMAAEQASAIDQESNMDMFGALNRLEEKYKEVIILKYLKGYAQDEIAAALNLPVGTVKSRLYRGLLILRKEIGGDENHDL
ncbi:RNA polymerase sigma factor [Neobacillus notoginsengisoli]|uniref:RNA polymerase sigma factor n=1 Tax=Neobacillus notoginsengisoli TaxID=1578198 RepID=A0A417YSZ9_9BACI|nr:RNA polymerase sigma factor [Neobacillus notoginsengisoli]RHW39138.1 RNA polymerase sigma factor [Neobacillus notoginsengisoli]